MGTWPPQCRSRKHGMSCQVKGLVMGTPTPGSSASPCGPKAPRQMQATLWRLWESSVLGPRPKRAGKLHRHQCSLGTSLLEGPNSSCAPECAGNKAERPPALGSDGSPLQIVCEVEGRESPKMSLSGDWRVSRPPLCGRPNQGKVG